MGSQTDREVETHMNRQTYRYLLTERQVDVNKTTYFLSIVKQTNGTDVQKSSQEKTGIQTDRRSDRQTG